MVRRMTVRPQPLLSVADVPRASDWYCALLGGEPGHTGTEYGRIMVGGALVLQLHTLDADHHHGPLADPGVPLGNGLLNWFAVGDFEAAVARARDLGAPVVTDVHVNPNSGRREFWTRDPDGYGVVLADGP